MGQLFDFLFVPPEMPAIHVPLPKMAAESVLSAFSAAFRLAYFAGVRDGFVAGILAALVVLPGTRRHGD